VVTKLLRKPMQILSDKVDKILAGIETKDDLKYVQYSAHDDSIANTLLFLDPINHPFVDIPYASNIFFELHYDD
jgi:hypothetical protein